MRVITTTLACGPKIGTRPEGTILDLPNADAIEMIKSGHAAEYDPEKPLRDARSKKAKDAENADKAKGDKAAEPDKGE